jgi:cellulose synthase/poly-beta-1,6-N-acetylglucosamine synthase-like glycosyltransferase
VAEVSVIIPTLNEEANIGKTLKLVRAQRSRLDYEVIVSDGGSTDKTVDIAKKYADKVVVSEKRGIWFGRNQGAKAAKGEVYVFIDADTMIPKNYVDSVYPAFGDPRIAGLSCAFEFDERTTKLRIIAEICNEYLLFKGSLGRGELLGFNAVVSKKYFILAGGFPNAPLEDGALAVKLRKLGRVVFLPVPKVITSARRIEQQGAVKSTLYYAQLALESSLPKSPLKRLLLYRKYIPVR